MSAGTLTGVNFQAFVHVTSGTLFRSEFSEITECEWRDTAKEWVFWNSCTWLLPHCLGVWFLKFLNVSAGTLPRGSLVNLMHWSAPGCWNFSFLKFIHVSSGILTRSKYSEICACEGRDTGESEFSESHACECLDTYRSEFSEISASSEGILHGSEFSEIWTWKCWDTAWNWHFWNSVIWVPGILPGSHFWEISARTLTWSEFSEIHSCVWWNTVQE